MSKSRVSKEQSVSGGEDEEQRQVIYAAQRINMYYWNGLSGAAKKQICDVEEREEATVI